MSNNKPLILIDTSYTSFYRFFATIRWFSHAYPEEYKIFKLDNKYDWLKNEIFIKKYEKMYLESIIKLVKKKIFDNSNIIFCMDTPKEKLWRMKIQDNYKSGRCDLSLKYNYKTTFDYTYNILIPKIINNKNIYKIRVDNVEADDIIAAICIHLSNINPILNIYLVSGDEDFLQLGRNNLIFINYRKKKQFTLSLDEAYNALQHKIINGDKSDCIPSIFPKGKRINKKELIESNEKLISYLELNNDIKKQYEKNKLMIDFKNIPKIYFDKIIKSFNLLIKY